MQFNERNMDRRSICVSDSLQCINIGTFDKNIMACFKYFRDQLNQQTEVIQQLNAELQKERIEKQRLLSNRFNNFSSNKEHTHNYKNTDKSPSFESISHALLHVASA